MRPTRLTAGLGLLCHLMTPAHASEASGVFCGPTDDSRPCTAFEIPDVNGVCPCTGTGNQVAFTLVVGYISVPGLLPVPRRLIGVNGTVPGPALVVNEGDWVTVTVINALTDDSTTIHWHGMFLVGNPEMDGVPALSQCTIPIGQSMDYHFRASVGGTYWYHGHYHEQYTNGLYGPLNILHVNEAAQLEYDSDTTLMIGDYFNNEAQYLLNSYYLTPASGGNEPIPDAITLNGAFSGTLAVSGAPGSRMRLRFVSASALSMFTVSIDGLALTIVETDGTLVEPYQVSSFDINVAQRVSIIVDLSQLPANVTDVWLRVTTMASMYATDITDYVPPYETGSGAVPLNPNYLAWIHVGPTPPSNPPNYTTPIALPAQFAALAPAGDMNLMDARPSSVLLAPPATHSLGLLLAFSNDNSGVNRGSINGMSAAHGMPSSSNPLPLLYQYYSGQTGVPVASSLTSWGADPSLIPITGDDMNNYYLPYGAIIDLIINNTDTGEHPWHFHGHEVWLIATSIYPDNEAARAGNYLRRDVVSLPAEGWAKVRLVADNPGIFISHCHITVHSSNGLLVTFVEAPSELARAHVSIPAVDYLMCPGYVPPASASPSSNSSVSATPVASASQMSSMLYYYGNTSSTTTEVYTLSLPIASVAAFLSVALVVCVAARV